MISRLGWLVVAMMIAGAGPAAARDQDEGRSITVSGKAEVRVVPDEVVVSVGIETMNRNLLAAKKDNDRRALALLRGTDSLEVPRAQVHMDYLSIEPVYEFGSRHERTFIGYQVRKTIVITLRDLDTFEDLLTAVLSAGANTIHGVEFRTTELRKHRDKARELALAAAKEKARDMAAHLGQSIGDPELIDEVSSDWWSPYSSWWGRSRGQGMSQNIVQNSTPSSESSEGPTPPGQIAVSATVNVMFNLVD